MSKTVDERVVSMQFDNKQFEANVNTSMSTIDKLKAKLDFKGATKGMEDIGTATKNVNMSGLGSAVESVRVKFSALQVMGVTALANITNSAINAGKRMVSALSLDQIRAGFQKFSDKTTSVATLQAQGNALEDVNEQLDKLNWFTDETSYNFTDMVSNIAKFTATGKGLEESVTAMEGIATWAALSGQNASTASRAMYQLSQAMGSGVMRKEDYKSIQNASMDTEEFRKKCIEAGIALGTLKDNGDGTFTSLKANVKDGAFTISQFADHLTEDMWLTSDVMMKVFNEYSSAVAGIYDAADESGKLASEIIDEIHTKADELKTATMTDEEAIDAAIKELGYTLEDGSLKFDSFGLKAFEAAQKARTFQDAIDATKDAVSTGWMKTFEIIFGDAEKATELWTDLANTLWDLFASSGEVRNTILDYALNFANTWTKISEKLNNNSALKKIKQLTELGNSSGFNKIKEIGKSIERVGDKVKSAADKLEYFQEVVNKVWRGDYSVKGADPDRFDLLTKEGYDPRVIQELVNKGYQYQLTVEDIENAYKKYGITLESTTETTDGLALTYTKLSDKQLMLAGLTEDEISLYRDLEKEANRLGISVNELAEEMSTNDGRTLLVDSFKNALDGLLGILTAIKNAFSEIFFPEGVGELSIKIYNLVKSLNKFSEKLRLTDKDTGELNETGKKIQRTFKGVFAILDIITTIIGGGFKTAFKIISKVLEAFDIDILDITASIGDVIVKFRDWIREHSLFAKVFNKTVDIIVKVISAISKWFKEFSKFPAVQNTIKKFKKVFTFDNIKKTIESCTSAVKKWIDALMQLPLVGDIIDGVKSVFEKMSSVGKDLVEGLKEGLNDGSKTLWDVLVDFGKSILEKICDILGIHSPSTKTARYGRNLVQGFVNGIKEESSTLWKTLKGFASKIIDFLGNVDWSKVFVAGISTGFLVVFNKMSNALEDIASPLGGVGSILESTAKIMKKSAGKIKKILNNVDKVVKSFSKLLNAIAFEHTAKGIKDLAISLAILVGAIILLTVLADPEELWQAVGVIGALAGILLALSVVATLLSKTSLSISKEGLKSQNTYSAILMIAISLLVLASVVKKIGSMNPEQALVGFLGLEALVLTILEVMIVCSLLTKGQHGANANKIALTLLSVAMLFKVLASIVKKLGKMKPEQALKGLIGLKLIALTIIAVMAICSLLIKGDRGANADKIALTLLSIAGVFWVLGKVAKILSKMSWEGMGKAAVGITGLAGIIVRLIAVTRLASGGEASKIGGTLLAVAGAIAILAIVAKIISGMSWEGMGKAAVGITGLAGIIVRLIAVTRLASGGEASKIGGTLLSIAVAIGILAGVAILLSYVPIENLKQGLIIVSVLGAIVSGMIAATRNAQDCKNNLIVMAVIIALLAAAVYALSTIEDTSKLYAAVIALSAVLGAFALVMLSTKNFKDVDVAPLMLMLLVIAVLSAILMQLSTLDVGSSIKTVESLALLMLTLSAALYIISNSKSMDLKQVSSIALAMVALTVVLAGIGLVLAMMTALPVKNAITNALALSVLMLALSAALLIVSYSKSMNLKQVASMTLSMVALTVVLGLIGLVLVMMTALPVKDAITNALALSALMLALSAALFIISYSKPMDIKQVGLAALSMVALTVVLGLIGLVLVMMTALPVKNAETNASVLSNLLITLAGVAVVLAVIGALTVFIIVGAIGLLALVVVMDLLVSILGKMEDPKIKNGAKNAAILGYLLMLMTNVCVILAKVGPLALIGVAAMAALEILMLSIISFAMIIGGLMESIGGLEDFLDRGLSIMIKVAGAIGEMIGALIEAIATSIMTILPPMGAALSKFMKNASYFIAGIKKVDEKVLSGVKNLALAIIALTVAELITAVGSFHGLNFVFLGLQLSAFAIAALPFITFLGLISPETAAAAHNLAELIMAITVASVIDGIASLLGIGSIDEFGGKLASFGEGIKSFSESISDLTEDDLDKVDIAAQAGKMLADMASNIPKSGGWVQKILGESDMLKFSNSISAFGEAMVSFRDSVRTITDNDFDKISTATKCGKELADLNESIPKSDGWAQEILGSEDMGNFGEGIKAYGAALVEYIKTIRGLTDADFNKASIATKCGKELADLNGSIPESDGWAQEILGSQDMGDFGDSLIAFGEGLAGFCDATSSIKANAVKQTSLSGDVLDAILVVCDKIPADDNWWDKFVGSATNVGAFGDSIGSLGLGLSDYINAVKGISDSDISNIDKSGEAISSLGEVAQLVPNDNLVADAEDSRDFIRKMSIVPTKIAEYVDAAAAIDNKFLIRIALTKLALTAIINVVRGIKNDDSDSIKKTIKIITNIKNAIIDLSREDFTGANKFKDAVDVIASSDIDGFKTTMKGLSEVSFKDFISGLKQCASDSDKIGEELVSKLSTSITTSNKDFVSAGKKLMGCFNEGMSSKMEDSAAIMFLIAKKCYFTLSRRSIKNDFYDAGKNLVKGFARGISENSFIAEIKAAAMADSAYEAAKEALDINSPSKIFRKLGFSIPEGLAMGIDKLGYVVGNSVISMTDSAIRGTKNAISRIASIVTSDIDAQPTIRPVLDLSDIKSGANAIRNMLNGQTMSVATRNVGTINSTMRYNQNGTNSDVISAIEDLGRRLGNGYGNTYNINGITYDDGSEVSNAIKTLIRAAKIERRS